MPSSGVITAVGEGEFLLGTFAPVEEVHIIITVPGFSVQYRSATQPRRVMHAGYVAMGHNFNGGPSSPANPSTVTWHKYVEFEDEWGRPQLNPTPFYFERVLWAIPMGVTVTVEATWP
jgi:hypothetical protein